DYFLGQGLKVAQDLCGIYYGEKSWHLIKSDTDKVFVTSDAPVSILRPSHVPAAMNAGYGNGTIFIPISPKPGLLLRDSSLGGSMVKANDKLVDFLNKNTMGFSDNYIFSNVKSKSLFETYKRVGKGRFRAVTATRL